MLCYISCHGYGYVQYRITNIDMDMVMHMIIFTVVLAMSLCYGYVYFYCYIPGRVTVDSRLMITRMVNGIVSVMVMTRASVHAIVNI